MAERHTHLLGQRLRAFSGNDRTDTVTEGRCIAASSGPMVCIQKDDGDKIWWLVRLVEPTTANETVGEEIELPRRVSEPSPVLNWTFQDVPVMTPRELVFNGRTLAIVDPEDREQIDQLALLYMRTWCTGDPIDPESIRICADQMQAALQEYANPTPSKPEEPTNWLAAVEDADGNRWVRDGLCRDGASEGDWWCVDRAANHSPDPWRADYARINAVRVLSEGVTP